MFNVSFRRLQVFLAVVQQGSFAGAAKQLNIAQPSVSTHIRALEQEAGGLVFKRQRGRAAVLTSLGRSLLERARHLVDEASDIEASLAKAQDEEPGQIVFVCQRPLARLALRNGLVGVIRQMPQVQFSVRLNSHERVVDMLLCGAADIGCFLDDGTITELPSEVIGTCRVVLVVSPYHPLARRRELDAEEIGRHAFILPPEQTFFGRSVRTLLTRAGIGEIKTVAHAMELQLIREMAIANMGIACLTEHDVEDDIRSGVLTALHLNGSDFTLEVRAATSPVRPPTQAVKELATLLRRNGVAGMADETLVNFASECLSKKEQQEPQLLLEGNLV